MLQALSLPEECLRLKQQPGYLHSVIIHGSLLILIAQGIAGT
jgi:hypothetical protein